jgi:hypothetical protein
MASGTEVRQSLRERQTPDSVRNSYIQLSSTRPEGTSPGTPTRNGTPPVEKDSDKFR